MSLNKINIRSFFFSITTFIAITILFSSCAQIVPLTGGEKDIESPKELESSPQNGSTLFNSETVTIQFDEYIKLTNISSQLIVSPLMETPPEVMVKGKKLVIKLKSELAPNTTYSLNFGNAISDITENNVYPNYKYVFSTGDYIDSLSYSGTVINAFDATPKENIYVLLYDQFEDSVPLKELPRYVALTNKKGEFSITNIAQGDYKLFAINDVNSNYLFDLPNEAIGFKNDAVSIQKSDTNSFVYLFEEENDLQFLVNSEYKSYGKIDLIFNKPTQELSISILNNEEKENWSVIEKNDTKDSITIWLYPEFIDKEIDLLVKDQNEIIDTLNFDLITPNQFKDSVVSVKSNASGSFDLNKNVILKTNRPFKSYRSENIKLYEDSNLVSKNNFSDIDLRAFELAYDFKENTPYQLLLLPNSFEDIYGLKNDTVKVNFKTKKVSDYGVINLAINPNFSENYIIQLFKGKQLVSEKFLSGNQTQQYKYLSPGAYSLKLIVDKNNDKKWNTGNYLKGLQPEKVIIYQKEIKIRANWDNDINWT
ncbi:MAG: Ig-like domain-containing protein, partial [Vicingaceae bacterium]